MNHPFTSIIIPVKNHNPYLEECIAHCQRLDYPDYDMGKPVAETSLCEHEIIEATQELYKVFFTPQYILRRLVSIRNFNDLNFIERGLTKISGHIKDFSFPKGTP